MSRTSATLDQAIDAISRVEQRHHIDLGIRAVAQTRIVDWLGNAGACWDWPLYRKVLYLSPTLCGRELREVLYHAMGHALLDEYDVRSMLGVFTRRGQELTIWDWRRYASDGRRFTNAGRTDGFCSGYARTTRDEDFCETFSCYLVNGCRTRGSFAYADDRFHTDGDERLQQKLARVREVLRACRGK